MSKIKESELKTLQEQEQKKSAILHDLGGQSSEDFVQQ